MFKNEYINDICDKFNDLIGEFWDDYKLENPKHFKEYVTKRIEILKF